MGDIWKHYLQPWRSMLSCLPLSGSTFSCFGQWSCLYHPAIAHSVAINIYILPLMIAFGRLLGFKGPLFEFHTGESKILSIKCWHLSHNSLMCYERRWEKDLRKGAHRGPVRPSACCPKDPLLSSVNAFIAQREHCATCAEIFVVVQLLSVVWLFIIPWTTHQLTLALRLLNGPTLTSIHDYLKNNSFDSKYLCWQSNISAF